MSSGSGMVVFAVIGYFLGRGKMLQVWIPLGVAAIFLYSPRSDRLTFILLGLAIAVTYLLKARATRTPASQQ